VGKSKQLSMGSQGLDRCKKLYYLVAVFTSIVVMCIGTVSRRDMTDQVKQLQRVDVKRMAI
jgi:hypothetical protein